MRGRRISVLELQPTTKLRRDDDRSKIKGRVDALQLLAAQAQHQWKEPQMSEKAPYKRRRAV